MEMTEMDLCFLSLVGEALREEATSVLQLWDELHRRKIEQERAVEELRDKLRALESKRYHLGGRLREVCRQMYKEHKVPGVTPPSFGSRQDCICGLAS